MNESPQPSPRSTRLRTAAIVTIGIVVAVFVLFTWVFPWITEMGLSPALD